MTTHITDKDGKSIDASTATIPSDISLDIEPTQEELLAIELELENE